MSLPFLPVRRIGERPDPIRSTRNPPTRNPRQSQDRTPPISRSPRRRPGPVEAGSQVDLVPRSTSPAGSEPGADGPRPGHPTAEFHDSRHRRGVCGGVGRGQLRASGSAPESHWQPRAVAADDGCLRRRAPNGHRQPRNDRERRQVRWPGSESARQPARFETNRGHHGAELTSLSLRRRSGLPITSSFPSPSPSR
jgi:hypothetical protein